jgi:hypothetical protein
MKRQNDKQRQQIGTVEDRSCNFCDTAFGQLRQVLVRLIRVVILTLLHMIQNHTSFRMSVFYFDDYFESIWNF